MAERDLPGELKHLAHDVRNALNGVAVNLEVARARVTRGGSSEQIAPFLETAAQQLDVAARLHKRYAALADEMATHTMVRGRADPG